MNQAADGTIEIPLLFYKKSLKSEKINIIIQDKLDTTPEIVSGTAEKQSISGVKSIQTTMIVQYQDGEVCDDEWVDPAEVGEPSGGDAAERVGDADDGDEEVGVLDGDAVQRRLQL